MEVKSANEVRLLMRTSIFIRQLAPPIRSLLNSVMVSDWFDTAQNVRSNLVWNRVLFLCFDVNLYEQLNDSANYCVQKR